VRRDVVPQASLRALLASTITGNDIDRMLDLRSMIGNADEFPILKSWDYFNHAGVSPWPVRTIRAVTRFAETFGVDCFQSQNPDETLGRLRSRLARFINAFDDEVALVRNTGDAISQIAGGLHWQRGDVIIAPACEYPSNLYPWMDACNRFGCELVLVPERTDQAGVARVSEDELIDVATRRRAKLIAVSHVQWGSGQRMNLNAIGRFCRDAGVLFAVDAIQSLGVVPVDVRADHIDFVFSGGHKWLMSPPGAGLLYCRRELLERVSPPAVGWLSVVNPYRWEMNFTLRTEAGRFETGTHAYACLAGMDESIGLLQQIGIDAIHAHVRGLGDRFADGIRSAGYVVATPRDGDVGGAVCFNHPTKNPDELVRILRKEHRIELASRCGRLRFAPHFYNTMEQTDRTIARMAALV
jgi:cysteine desulfurase / selenocysteine lyase